MNLRLLRNIGLAVVGAGAMCFLSQCNNATEPANNPPPFTDTLQIISPNGGETYKVGDTLTIRWKTDTTLVVKCLLDISFDDGISWFDIPVGDRGLSITNPLNSQFKWAVTATVFSYPDPQPTPSTKCKIKVRDYNRPAFSDESDRSFIITAQ